MWFSIGSMVLCLIPKVLVPLWVRLLSRVSLALLILRVCFLVLALLGLIFNMVQIHMVIGNLVNMVTVLHLNMVICLKIHMVIGLKTNMVLGFMVNMVLVFLFTTLFLILGVRSRLRLLTKVILKSLAFDVLGA
jgi:hypothetical protein